MLSSNDSREPEAKAAPRANRPAAQSRPTVGATPCGYRKAVGSYRQTRFDRPAVPSMINTISIDKAKIAWPLSNFAASHWLELRLETLARLHRVGGRDSGQ